MKDSSSQHKKVPNRMMKLQFFPAIEDNTSRVSQSTQNEQNNTAGGNGSDWRLNRHHDSPAHSYIQSQRYCSPSSQRGKLEYYPKKRKAPNHPKEPPTPWAMKTHQGNLGFQSHANLQVLLI